MNIAKWNGTRTTIMFWKQMSVTRDSCDNNKNIISCKIIKVVSSEE